ncbi:TetR/AcrR family transcriptional regulator [Anaerocolumna sp. AGMB13025]|uniref:TetR/AcrR family transcriptional regulator n=1 Tax=Anaerocolumna sp. AGMB13025 TaxID=3039116 RepID=UPI0024200297|nr:TetR/AcrR family transcriptional regulator [Anaerocolumna sp. AGMB13025]WFR58116.1 TetR/AcrR family transcriptional regulator [Anaerocolumna sp. AGMB13025]
MARSFSEAEKDNIRDKLIKECEKSWITIGYKNTKIDELCSKAGISKGAFYAFFDSKEHLFCRVFDVFQERHKALEETLPAFPVKEDICRMLKQLYLEYDKTKILTQRNSPDFISFLNRAPKEWLEKTQKISESFIADNIFNSNLKLKMSKEKAIGIFNALLAIVTNKDILYYDHYEVFCTLLDNIIDEIYE